MKTFIFSPIENIAHVDVGEEFQLESDGKYYLLIARNAITCVVAKETWWDKVVLFFRGESEYTKRTNGWPITSRSRRT